MLGFEPEENTYNLALAYLATDEGLYDLSGVNFTVVRITDIEGNELNKIELVSYNSQSDDVAKLKEELEQLKQLFEEYQEIQTIAGGGSGDLGEWWNSLTDTQKLGVIVGVIVLLALIFRR